ncbi:uncharacterized protein LOC115927489 [Strongylocentrotus purpuratus]|uniref:Uncharacterized protein n=1 Tax=Strongylocentrotus purpuratus TaxID=7668 RepID=A0A7M7PF50_STRPU|nr:uncharacterized protein LOC105445690 [Strongylocentrotus purpuratus]XP_030849348.1 uncharacterized protein LOC115927489 [Strongylocentrotus purpuratus]|eukprot:XP_011679838.1 PREDICTED: uncharacterized protein LOC105445690 [Strongylocentrotus purpuratus]
MGFRRRFIAFTGAVQILLTLAMFTMTSSLLNNFGNAAVGTPMWGALIILMCGAANIILALETPSTKRNTEDSILATNFNLGTVFANLTAFIVSATILALFSWALSLSTSFDALVVPFSTIVLAATLICLFSLFALFADCFSAFCASSPKQHHQSSPQGPYVMDYEGPPPRGIPNPALQRVMIDQHQSQFLTSSAGLRSPMAQVPNYY